MKTLYIVTGYSGAGKSTVLEACEDYGFFCVDNLPAELLTHFFETIQRDSHQSIALGLDIRSGVHHDEYLRTIVAFKKLHQVHVKIIFLRAQPDILVQRFRETRRNHPLRAHGLVHAIADEMRLLEPLRQHADFVLDTDHMTIQQLRLWVRHVCSPELIQSFLAVTLRSFGFKWGDQPVCDTLFDLRFLSNPYHVAGLKEHYGDEQILQEWLFAQPDVHEYWSRFKDFFVYTLERYQAEGRFFVTVGFGCTGGQHRSVAFAQRCSQLILPNVHFSVHHRDKMRGVPVGAGDYHEKDSTI